MFFSDSRLDGNPEAMRLAEILASGTTHRFDADQIGSATLFTLRQLQFVRSKIQKVLYPENRCATFLPLATDIPALVGQYVYYRRDYAGQSRLQNGNSKGPLPRIDNIKTGELIGHVYGLEGSYGWMLDELRQAARLAMDLPTMKAEAAREVIARDTDEVTRNGTLQVRNDDGTAEAGNLQTTGNMGGFTNHPNVGTGANTTVDGTTLLDNVIHKWFLTAGTTTPEQMVSDLSAIAQAVNYNTLTLFPPKTMLLPTAMYNLAATTKMSSASPVTVLKFFLDNNPYVTEVDQWIYLDNAGVTKNSLPSHRVICYSRNPDIIENVNPIDFETQPAQVEGFQYIIPCRGLTGAVKVYRPNAMVYVDFSKALT
jgi:hypothetical protein